MQPTTLHGTAVPGPKVLLVVAHPDDEYACAATVYRITQELGGIVDQLVITNGEGGYRYAQLAERIYGRSLTRETVGRACLPAIRKKETERAGRILGIRQHVFLNQRDTAFTLDVREALEELWDGAYVAWQLDRLLAAERYDFVFVMLPSEDTHGHHKAAALLALEGVARMEGADRPVVLGCAYRSSTESAERTFTVLPGFPLTRTLDADPVCCVDRRQPFGPDGSLDYAIIVHWMMAEHKSQGYFQTTYGQHDLEEFWYFAANGPGGLARVRDVFGALQPGLHVAPTLGRAA